MENNSHFSSWLVQLMQSWWPEEEPLFWFCWFRDFKIFDRSSGFTFCDYVSALNYIIWTVSFWNFFQLFLSCNLMSELFFFFFCCWEYLNEICSDFWITVFFLFSLHFIFCVCQFSSNFYCNSELIFVGLPEIFHILKYEYIYWNMSAPVDPPSTLNYLKQCLFVFCFCFVFCLLVFLFFSFFFYVFLFLFFV